jgi:hypothetical protein
MSLLLNHTLADATALLRGETFTPTASQHNSGFPLDGLSAFRLTGLHAVPGHAALDSDEAWLAVVRSWWSTGTTWGLCVATEADGHAWNLIASETHPAALDAVRSHLTGARLQAAGELRSLAARLQRMPFRGVMSGHTGIGSMARIESALRFMNGANMMILTIAKPCYRQEISSELQRLAGEEQFVRDEHLSRQSLERESHSSATRYLELIEAARNRAATAMQEGGWHVRTLIAAVNEPAFRRLQGLLHGAYSADGGQPEPLRWQEIGDPRKTVFLRSAEAAALSRPPQRELPGFFIETHIGGNGTSGTASSPAIFSVATSPVNAGASIAVGRILNDSGHPGSWLEISPDDFCRHLLVAGMPGSGKSVTCEHILLTLWLEHRIPSLVIEPGLKTAYRRLLNSEIASDLKVLSIGNPLSPRLPMNPLAVPPGVGLAEHTSALFAVIASAFELVAPMPEVLATAIEQTYRNHGWSLSGVAPKGPPPRLADLVREVDRCSRTTGHSTEVTANIRAGLLLRLRRLLDGPLGPELSSAQGLDIAALTRKPTVIELSCLPDAESQALVMGFLALQLRHHWRMSGLSDSLRHLTVIEEAHRLLKAVPETSANAARTRAVEDLGHMLAELRGFGAGLAIVDQTPSVLVPSVIANTGTKILHRLDHPADRELAGRAAGLPADQVDLLGALQPGDAVLRSDRRPKPFRLRMPNPSVTYGRLPLPELPKPTVPLEPARNIDKCPVCGAAECHARAEAANPNKLRDRLIALQSALLAGEEATWQWARRELHYQSDQLMPPSAPLCFLVTLGEKAGLNPVTLERIRQSLSRFINPYQP